MKEIQKKLLAIQQALRAPKSQRNEFNGFNYRSAEDILEAVKPLLASQGLTLVLSDKMEYIGERYYIKATATLSDGEEEITATAYAREDESRAGMSDSQVTGCSSSYARKYCLNGLFCIDDGKDSDSFDNRQNKPSQPYQRAESTMTPQQSLDAFYDTVKGQVDDTELEKFHGYYTDLFKTKGWNGEFRAQALFNSWMSRKRN